MNKGVRVQANWFDRQPGAYTSLHRAPPKLWRWLAGGEVTGPISVAMTADGAGTAAVETGMTPPVQSMQKTSPRPEKQFLDCQLAAPEKKKEEKPAGLKTRPAWWPQDCLGTCPFGRPWRHGLPGMATASVHALRRLTETILSCDPTLMAKKRGPRCKTV